MHYKAFVHSYYRWYNRMAAGDGPNYVPCLLLSTLQAVNLVCLSLVLIPGSIPTWAVMAGAGLTVLVMYPRNRAIFDTLDEAPRFSRWSDNVPSFGELPAVYAYLMVTVALLVLPILVSTSG